MIETRDCEATRGIKTTLKTKQSQNSEILFLVELNVEGKSLYKFFLLSRYLNLYNNNIINLNFQVFFIFNSKF